MSRDNSMHSVSLMPPHQSRHVPADTLRHLRIGARRHLGKALRRDFPCQQQMSYDPQTLTPFLDANEVPGFNLMVSPPAVNITA